MLAIINLLRGFYIIQIKGSYTEWFLNICSAVGVAFWDLNWIDENTLTARVRVGDIARIPELASRALCEVEVLSKHGAPFFFLRFRTRYLFIAGLVLCAVVVYSLSLRVWDIEVTGNENVSSELILRHLEQLGVKEGVRAKDIDPERLEDLMLLRISELSWFTVNVSGSRAVVEVRERVRAPVPVNEKEPCNIVARKAGIIEKITVLEGAAQVAVGDTVDKGQLLVSGIVDNVSGARIVRAMADVSARTWYTLTAKMPVDVSLKTYTGEKEAKRALIIAGKRINLYFTSSISFDSYDKIVDRKRLVLPGGFALPVIWESSKANEYTTSRAELDGADAEAVLAGQLFERLQNVAGDADVVLTDFEFDMQNGVLTATLIAECLEEISYVALIPTDGLVTPMTAAE